MAATPLMNSVSPTERAQVDRSVRLVERAAFDKDRGADVVAASQIGQEFGEQILQAAKDHLEEGMEGRQRGAWRHGRQHPLPEVMVRIDDGQIRLEDGFTTHGCTSWLIHMNITSC